MRKIFFSPPDITEAEIDAVCDVLRSGWLTTGPKTKQLERELATYCNTNKVVCLNSATAAEELNLRILGIGEGDEVIVPAYTYTATASAVMHVGAKVVFVDSQPDNPEMDYEAMAKVITKRTKAIIAVDLGGVVCDYEKIFDIAEKHRNIYTPNNEIQKALGRIAVLADCAHALGAQRNGKKTGEIADFTSFSFHAVKNLTTAEGGASTWRSIEGIDDEDIYRQYQLYSLHGQSKDALAKTQLGSWEYDIIGPWYKCNMTDVLAAIGLKQLERYEALMDRRRYIIQMYDKMCKEIGVDYLKHYNEKGMSSGHLYLTRIPGISVEERNEIIIKMAERGITCNVHYKPLPMMSAYKELGFSIVNFPNAYHYFENLISLPLHTQLSDEDVNYVVENYKEIVERYIC